MELARAVAPGGVELMLHERDGVFTLRADGYELMTSREHRSEDSLATETLAILPSLDVRILIGGLGFGFTARAALRVLPRTAEVIVAEVSPEVISWNQTHLSTLWPDGLDERLEVVAGDVATALERGPFAAILLDVDNGPSPLVQAVNERLYSFEGLSALYGALSDPGVLGVWSAVEDAEFEDRMSSAGFATEARLVPLARTEHRLFLGTKRQPTARSAARPYCPATVEGTTSIRPSSPFLATT